MHLIYFVYSEIYAKIQCKNSLKKCHEFENRNSYNLPWK